MRVVHGVRRYPDRSWHRRSPTRCGARRRPSRTTSASSAERRRRTIEAYRRDLRRYLRCLAAAGVTEVERRRPRRTSSTRSISVARSGVAASTLNRTSRRSVTSTSSASASRSPRPTPPRSSTVRAGVCQLPKAIDDDEVDKIIEAASGTGARDLRDRAMLELLYGGGTARVGARRAWTSTMSISRTRPCAASVRATRNGSSRSGARPHGGAPKYVRRGTARSRLHRSGPRAALFLNAAGGGCPARARGGA